MNDSELRKYGPVLGVQWNTHIIEKIDIDALAKNGMIWPHEPVKLFARRL